MKRFFAILVLLSSGLSHAALENLDYVGCLDAGTDEYSVLLNITNGRVASYSTLESDLQDEIPVSPIDTSLSIRYSSEYDTNLWYDFALTDKMTEAITVVPWTSGNDSDNYHGSPSHQIVQCHLLHTKPTSAILKTENYKQSIAVKNSL